MKATVKSIRREPDGRRSVTLKFSNILTIGGIITILTGLANIIIFVNNTMVELSTLKRNWEYQIRFDEAVKSCIWKHHQVNILDFMPNDEDVVRGGGLSNNENKDAKHEDLLTFQK